MPQIQCVHRQACVSEGQALGQAEEPRPAHCCTLYTDRTVYSRPAAAGMQGQCVWAGGVGKKVLVSGSVPESRDGLGLWQLTHTDMSNL